MTWHDRERLIRLATALTRHTALTPSELNWLRGSDVLLDEEMMLGALVAGEIGAPLKVPALGVGSGPTRRWFRIPRRLAQQILEAVSEDGRLLPHPLDALRLVNVGGAHDLVERRRETIRSWAQTLDAAEIRRRLGWASSAEWPTWGPSEQDLELFYLAATNDPDAAFWLLIIVGVRPVEELALQFGDLAEGWLSVWRSTRPRPIQRPRTIALPPTVDAALLRRMSQSLSLYGGGQTADLVFRAPSGGGWTRKYCDLALRRLQHQNGLRNWDLGNLRSGGEALLRRLNLSESVIEMWMGRGAVAQLDQDLLLDAAHRMEGWMTYVAARPPVPATASRQQLAGAA